MKLFDLYFVGTSNKVVDYSVQAKSAKEAKLLALTLAGLNPAMIIRIKAKQVNQ